MIKAIISNLQEFNSFKKVFLNFSFHKIYYIGFSLFLFFSNSLFSQTGQIRGRVVDANGEPLVSATVFIPELKLGAYTNESGIFSINKVPDGTHGVIAMYLGYDSTYQVIDIARDQTVTIRLVLNERYLSTEEVEIVAQKTGEINTKQVDLGKIGISNREINLLPSIGTPDLAQFLQVLPGVVFTGDQGGQVYIRGGTPIQNMVLLDGMIIYSPFHSIGLFSVFDPDYIRSVDVYSAAFPGQYGGRISSVIDIKTRNGSFNGIKVKAHANPFMAGVLLEGPMGKPKRQGRGSSFILSARNNYIDQTSPTLYNYINDSTGLPYNFLDIYGKLTFSDGVNYLNIFGFRQTDNVNFEFPANISWDAFGGGANFQLLPSGAGAIISGNFAYSQYKTGLRSQSENFPRESSISGFNGGLNVGYIINSIDEFAFGVTFLGFSTDYTFTNSFGLITESIANNTEAALYAKYKKVVKVGDIDRMVIEPSIRLHYFNDQTHLSAEPRLRAKLNLPSVSFSFATGLYTQNLVAAVSDRDVVNLFQGFLSAPTALANRVKDHNLQTSWHAVGGVEMELFPNLTTSIEGWLKRFTQLTGINRLKVFPSDPNFITETGNAFGVDLLLKYQTPQLYLYGTYGWAKVERTDQTQTYSPVWDRRHTVNLVGAYNTGTFPNQGRRPKFKESKWEFSTRWTMGSGFPFTQTQGYFEKVNFLDNGVQTDIFNQNGTLGLILSDELNGGRLPYYHRLDFSAKRRWVLKQKVLIELSANAINVYDRDNIFYFDRIRFAPVYQLPFLPTLGLMVKY